MARKRQDKRDQATRELASQGQTSPGTPHPPQSDTTGTDGRPQAPAPKIRTPRPVGRKKPRSDPQPSSLSNAQYLWLSRRPAWLQNIILGACIVASLSWFTEKSIATAGRIYERIRPKSIPPILISVRNDSDLDQYLSTTGIFTIQTDHPVPGDFDLKPKQTDGKSDGRVICVPGKGKQVQVCATIRYPRDFFEYYSRGRHPLTLTLAVGTERYIVQVDEFSKNGLTKTWEAWPLSIGASPVISVCFVPLGNSSSADGDTDSIIGHLERFVDAGALFKRYDAPCFDAVKHGVQPKDPLRTLVKVEVGIRDGDTGKRLVFNVSDTEDRITQGHGEPRYDPQYRDELCRQTTKFITQVVTDQYPIEGRLFNPHGLDGRTVDMTVGSFSGVRERTRLNVYASADSNKPIGEVDIDKVYEHTSIGTLTLHGQYDPRTIDGLRVSSR